ncbi:hypothetical protein AAG906_027741 [Vitis piasezkii]
MQERLSSVISRILLRLSCQAELHDATQVRGAYTHKGGRGQLHSVSSMGSPVERTICAKNQFLFPLLATWQF